MKRVLNRWWADVLHLLYPELCICCEQSVPVSGSIFCVRCVYHLSLTHDFDQRNNDFTKQFWGRIPLCSGAAMFPFVKGGRSQQLIHRIKYEGRKDAGKMLGKWIAGVLREKRFFSGIQGVVPVPLHRKRRRQRGYNQSAVFGQGIAEGMDIPLFDGAIKRSVHTESQTGKSRTERVRNLSEAIIPNPEFELSDKWILLVDDVMTTGSTLEACALALQEMGVGHISMLTIAKGK